MASRQLVSIRPIIVVHVAGDVDGSRVSDIVIDGLSLELPNVTLDLLRNVNTWDGEIIQFLENIRQALEPEARVMLPLADEVADG